MSAFPEPQVVTEAGAWKAAGASHPGKVRTANEDRYHCDPARGIYVVIDGVGGHRAGEVAAGIALQVVLERLRRRTGTPEERLREAVALANNEVYRQAQEEPGRQGMACVLTAAVVEDGRVTVGHVGDTRLYKVQAGTIRKLTHDHSPVGMREDAGDLSETDAMRHPRRNEIFRDVGTAARDPHDPDFIEVVQERCEPDGALLLCSDGLTDLVPAAEILRTLHRYAGRPEEAVQRLIEQANEAGGKDNVTVVVAEGKGFAGAVERAAGGRARPSRSSSASGLAGRGAFFIYGVLVGLVALLLAQALLLDRRRPVRPTAPAALLVGADSTAPYRSIGAAMAAAEAGDVVTVAPGEYAEAVRVKEGVQLVSRTPRAAVIRPAGADTAAVVLESGSRLAGFRVLGGAAEGLVTGIAVQGTGATVEDVEVRGIRGTGVVFDSLSSGTLRASRLLENSGVGLLVRGGAAPRVVHNVILTPEGETAPPGVQIAPTAEPLLEENVIGGAADSLITPPSRTQALTERNFLNIQRE